MYTELHISRTKFEGVIASRRGSEIWLKKWLEKATWKIFPPTVSKKKKQMEAIKVYEEHEWG